MPVTLLRPLDRRQAKFHRALTTLHEQYESNLGPSILAGTLSRSKICRLAEQVYLQEKWPSHIAHVYLNLDDVALSDRAVVSYILNIIRSENLGVGSKGINHTDLAKQFALAMRVSWPRLARARPTVPNRMLMDWCDMSAGERPWLEALAVQVACENQMPTMRQIARGLVRHYGLRRAHILFWLVHGGPVERKHAADGLWLLATRTPRNDEHSVLYSYRMTCRLVCEFYDSILEG